VGFDPTFEQLMASAVLGIVVSCCLLLFFVLARPQLSARAAWCVCDDGRIAVKEFLK
jgi:hypothetical protein